MMHVDNRAAITADNYEHAVTNIVALAKTGRWSRRVTYHPPTEANPRSGIIRISDSRTGQFLEIVADPIGLWIWVNKRDGEGDERLTAATRSPVRQGAVIRATRRAVKMWRDGERIPDGRKSLEVLLDKEK